MKLESGWMRNGMAADARDLAEASSLARLHRRKATGAEREARQMEAQAKRVAAAVRRAARERHTHYMQWLTVSPKRKSSRANSQRRRPRFERMGATRTNVQARVQNLEAAVTDANMWLRRRAARHERDRLCYRLGAALEPAGGLQVDDVFLSGLDLLGGHGVALLAAAALAAPGGTSLSELMVRMAPTRAGRIVRDWGAWSRFTWLRDLYRQVVADFQASPAGRDPRRSWRKAAPTARQQYLVGELARFLQLDRPELVCRGDAHDWLLAQGGNPRFQVRPELPPLPTLADLAD